MDRKPLPKSQYSGSLPPGGLYWKDNLPHKGGLNRWQINHFRLISVVEYMEGVVQGAAERLMTRLGFQYRKMDYVPTNEEIVEKLAPLDRQINELVTINGKTAAVETLVKQNYDLKGKYRHFFEGGRLPNKVTMDMVDDYLGDTKQDRPMESYTMEAYTRRMTDELAQVVRRHIEETVAQGVSMNWTRGRKQEELRRRFLEEQSKRPDLDMSKAFPNVETVIRTESMKIMNAEAWNSASDVALLWGFTYNAVGDSRTRPTHEAQDGVSAEKNDPFWDVWAPPNGYNCRCWLVSEFEEPTSIKPPHRELQPDKGFAFNPAKRISGPGNAGFQPSRAPTPKITALKPVPAIVSAAPAPVNVPNPAQNASGRGKAVPKTGLKTSPAPVSGTKPASAVNRDTISVEDWYKIIEPSAPAKRKEVQPPIQKPKSEPIEVKPTGSGFVVEQEGKSVGTIVNLPSGKYVVTSGTSVQYAKTKAEAVKMVKEEAGKNGFGYNVPEIRELHPSYPISTWVDTDEDVQRKNELQQQLLEKHGIMVNYTGIDTRISEDFSAGIDKFVDNFGVWGLQGGIHISSGKEARQMQVSSLLAMFDPEKDSICYRPDFFDEYKKLRDFICEEFKSGNCSSNSINHISWHEMGHVLFWKLQNRLTLTKKIELENTIYELFDENLSNYENGKEFLSKKSIEDIYEMVAEAFANHLSDNSTVFATKVIAPIRNFI